MLFAMSITVNKVTSKQSTSRDLVRQAISIGGDAEDQELIGG